MTDSGATTDACFAATYALAFPDSRPWSAQEFRNFQTDELTHIFGNQYAFLVVRIIADEAEILTLATHPQYLRQGRALACLNQSIAYCKKRGVMRIFLEVADDNKAAQTLYNHSGFTIFGRRKRYYQRAAGLRVDALLLERQV